jgi:hypothetical protein
MLSETVTAPRPEARVASTTIGSRVVEEAPLRAGPRVSIRAEVANDADSRRVRGIFRVDDDAYVIVGHIDADGVLRIAFPSDPQDDGFVRGNRSYQTHEFFAGFNSQYRFRARTSTIWNTVAAPDAYDGGFGYVFIIASWRPMRFDRFSDGYRWDTFDLVSDSYMNDPRPAIQELAARLAGDSGDAYTIQYARYTNTQVVYSDYYPIASAYDVGFCSGYRPFGFVSYGYSRYGYPVYSGFNYNLWYRGSRYYYDSFGDCYRPAYAPWGFGVGYRIAQVPIIVTPPRNQPRIFDLNGHRPTPVPRALPGYRMPQPGQTAPGEAQIEHRTAIDYRDRTTPGNDGNQTGPARRQPRIDAPTPVEHRERPVMQEPTRPAMQEPTPPVVQEPNRPVMQVPTRRSEPRDQTQPGMSIPQRVERPRMEYPGSENPRIANPRTENPRTENPRAGNPRSENPRPEYPRRESPRIETPRENPRSEPRSEPPRMAMPRPEPPRSEPARQPPPRAESPKTDARSEPPRSERPRTEPRKPPR